MADRDRTTMTSPTPVTDENDFRAFFNQSLPTSPDKPVEQMKAYQASRMLAIKKSRRVRFSPQVTSTPSKTPTSASRKLFPIFEKGFRPSEPKLKNENQSFSRNSSGGTPTSVNQGKRKHVTPRKLFLKSNDQYAIDAGQRNFDGVTCKTCRMVYTPGEVTDEAHHAEYHDTFVLGVRFNGWKSERVINNVSRGRIIQVFPDDRKNMLKKVDDLFNVADRELGIRVPVEQCLKGSSQFLLYVANEKRVAGFLAAEGITEGFRLLSDDPLTISSTPTPATVGIARLWVHPNYRRYGVATELLDTLRISFRFDRKIELNEIAFSDPTNEGRLFAQRYLGNKNFLVFNYLSEPTPTPKPIQPQKPKMPVRSPKVKPVEPVQTEKVEAPVKTTKPKATKAIKIPDSPLSSNGSIASSTASSSSNRVLRSSNSRKRLCPF